MINGIFDAASDIACVVFCVALIVYLVADTVVENSAAGKIQRVHEEVVMKLTDCRAKLAKGEDGK